MENGQLDAQILPHDVGKLAPLLVSILVSIERIADCLVNCGHSIAIFLIGRVW